MKAIKLLVGIFLAGALGTSVADTQGQAMPFPRPDVKFEYDASVTLSDGLQLKINVFRPSRPGRFPVIVTHGIYGKDVGWQTAPPYQVPWAKMLQKLPQLCEGSTCRFMRWEMPDPERWVPAGYVVIHADSRGSGKTAGYLDPLGARETQDFKELIEWAAAQQWSNGKVGLLGISYYAINQWQVAALQPKGLAAIVPWEGAVDHYRDIAYHGGVPSTTFSRLWFKTQILPNQHGNSASPFRDAITGESAVGAPIPAELLAGNRADVIQAGGLHPLDDEYYRQRTPDLTRIQVPTLSVGNWGGAGLHLRGNIEGYQAIASKQKWLRVHAGDHFSPFYAPESFLLQKSFFDRFLKGDRAAFSDQAPVRILVRNPLKPPTWRDEESWPLKGTQFKKFYLSSAAGALSEQLPPAPAEATYDALSSSATFKLPPSNEDREFTGPVKAKLWVRANTRDADYFVTLRLLDPAGNDVTFEGANAPAVPVTNGWLRLSQRKQDVPHSVDYRPRYLHTASEPVEVGAVYSVDVEIWPTSVVVPAGYTLALTVQGHDFEFPHITKGPFKGAFPFVHDGRDPNVFGGTHTLLFGGEFDSYLQLPLVAARR